MEGPVVKFIPYWRQCSEPIDDIRYILACLLGSCARVPWTLSMLWRVSTAAPIPLPAAVVVARPVVWQDSDR